MHHPDCILIPWERALHPCEVATKASRRKKNSKIAEELRCAWPRGHGTRFETPTVRLKSKAACSITQDPIGSNHEAKPLQFAQARYFTHRRNKVRLGCAGVGGSGFKTQQTPTTGSGSVSSATLAPHYHSVNRGLTLCSLFRQRCRNREQPQPASYIVLALSCQSGN
jgi:hypothetical protein